MSNARTLLTEIIDYFANCDEKPGDFWAHDDEFESYCLDHRSKDGTKFWLDLEKDGTISIMWKPATAAKPTVMFFTARAPRLSQETVDE